MDVIERMEEFVKDGLDIDGLEAEVFGAWPVCHAAQARCGFDLHAYTLTQHPGTPYWQLVKKVPLRDALEHPERYCAACLPSIQVNQMKLENWVAKCEGISSVRKNAGIDPQTYEDVKHLYRTLRSVVGNGSYPALVKWAEGAAAKVKSFNPAELIRERFLDEFHKELLMEAFKVPRVLSDKILEAEAASFQVWAKEMIRTLQARDSWVMAGVGIEKKRPSTSFLSTIFSDLYRVEEYSNLYLFPSSLMPWALTHTLHEAGVEVSRKPTDAEMETFKVLYTPHDITGAYRKVADALNAAMNV